MYFDTQFAISTFWRILKGVPISLAVTFGSLLLAFPFGLIFALVRNHNVKFFSPLIKVFNSFMRGTPMIIQIYIAYYGLPRILNALYASMHITANAYDVKPLLYAFIIFGLNTVAVLCEIFRSALSGVCCDQMEASCAVGLTRTQAYIRIILPQAMVGAVPNICSNVVRIFKNTSLLFVMAINDITGIAQTLAGSGYRYIEAYLDIFILYIILCLGMEKLFFMLEKKLKVYKLPC